MWPIVPVLVLVVWLVRHNSGGVGPMSPIARMFLLKGFAMLLALVLQFALWPLSLAHQVAGVLLGVGMLVFALPTVFIRGVVVPMGWARAAHAMTLLLRPCRLSADRRGAAVLFGTLALARCRRSPRTLRTLAWLDARLMREPALGGAGLVAAGLLMALRGEVIQARGLLWWAHQLPTKLQVSRAHAEARQWLMVQALSEGRWSEVAFLGQGYAPGWSSGVAKMAARIASIDPIPSNRRLWQAWLLTRHWRATWPVLQRALATSPWAGGAGASTAEPAPQPPANLPQALNGLAGALGTGPQDPSALAQAIAAVGSAFESASTRAHIEQMASQGVGSLRPSADAVLLACRGRLIELIVPLLERAPQPMALLDDPAAGPGSRAVLAEAARRVRDRLFADIEAQCADYLGRRTAENSFEALVEHRTWAGMRDAADRLLALDPSCEHALFQTMFAPVCNFAAFQHNTRKQMLLAYEMFAWLHLHARGNPEAQALLGRNVALIMGPS